jgi:energy-coupling factor transporter transmembrane protein EcfT
VVQLLDGYALAGAVVAAAVVAVAASPGRFRKLLRRSRWLLLAIAILFAWSTPGVLLVPDAGNWSPTTDGVLLGLVHAVRLVSLVAALAVLLETTPKEDLVGAIYALAAPLAALGVSRARLAVRLMLVFQYAEATPAADWRAWLGRPTPDAARQDRLLLQRRPLRDIDRLALALLAVGVAVVGTLT